MCRFGSGFLLSLLNAATTDETKDGGRFLEFDKIPFRDVCCKIFKKLKPHRANA